MAPGEGRHPVRSVAIHGSVEDETRKMVSYARGWRSQEKSLVEASSVSDVQIDHYTLV